MQFTKIINQILIKQVYAIPIEPGGSIAPTPPYYGGGNIGTQGNINFNLGEAGQGIIPHASPGNYESKFWGLISSLLSIVLPIAVLLLLLYLIWGGFEWITSGGDSSKLTQARNKIMHAVIGLILLASVVAIFGVLQQFLGVCIIKIGNMACPN